MAGKAQYGSYQFEDTGPWRNMYDTEKPYDPNTAAKFNLADLMAGKYQYDDLVNNVYGSYSGIGDNGGGGGPVYTAYDYNNDVAPSDAYGNAGRGTLQGLGSISALGLTRSLNDTWVNNGFWANPGSEYMGGANAVGQAPQYKYSNPTELYLDSYSATNPDPLRQSNYVIGKDPVTGQAKAVQSEAYQKHMGWDWGDTVISSLIAAGGGAVLGGALAGGELAAGAGEGSTLVGSGSATGGGLGGYGGEMATGAFDLGGTFGGVEGAGGFSSGLADLFGGGGSYLSGALDTGAFDLGGTYGGVEGAGGYTGDYFGSGLLGDYAGTGAMDMNGSQGANLGWGGSGNSSYGLSNLYDDAKGLYNQYGNFSDTVRQYTGQSPTQLARGLYDAYAKNQVSKNAGSRADQLESLFGQDSPYAQQMAKQLAVRDAALGRNSQYGPRSVELQAKLAEMQANVLNSKQYNDLRNVQTNSKLGMFNTLVANTAANTIAKNTPAIVSSALSSVAKFIGF